jgi:hypothetical protein
MSLLKYSQWNSLNEASLSDKITNYLENLFGGKISKINDIISSYRKSESRFVNEWEEIKKEVDKLELEKSQTKSDPAEMKRLERMIARNNELVSQANKAHQKKTDEIMRKVDKIISGNKRLEEYWETEKLRIDSFIAEQMYKRSKELADRNLTSDLYDEYRSVMMRSKEKDDAFKEMYGDLFSSGSYESLKNQRKPSTFSSMESTFELLAGTPLKDFIDEIKSVPADQAKKLLSFLLKERNNKYVEMDMEKENYMNSISYDTLTGVDKDDADKRIKEIRERYMKIVRDLRSKITIVRRYA